MIKTQYQELVELVANCHTDCCVIWPYNLTFDGYGTVFHPRTQQNMYASRAAFEIKYGYLPPVVRHICDNAPCFNPRHLCPGNHIDNVNDRVDRNRSATGEHNGRSKLTTDDVTDIFWSFKNNSELSRQFGIDRVVVRKIKEKKLWRTTTDELCEKRYVNDSENDLLF